MNGLTPADSGILAAAYDDAMRLGLGDDDTVEMIRTALPEHTDWATAYAFFRAATAIA